MKYFFKKINDALITGTYKNTVLDAVNSAFKDAETDEKFFSKVNNNMLCYKSAVLFIINLWSKEENLNKTGFLVLGRQLPDPTNLVCHCWAELDGKIYETNYAPSEHDPVEKLEIPFNLSYQELKTKILNWFKNQNYDNKKI